MADIIFAPGSYHGGWYFDAVAADLRGRGHRVVTPTLIGLADGERDHESIDLDAHVDHLIAVIEAEGLRDVVLIGHSYGGMVITGVIARKCVPVRQVIYLDAMLPVSGESLWDVIPDALRTAILAASPDGLSTVPPPDLAAIDARVVPHPIRSYRQPVVYADADFPARKTYVWAAGNPGSPFERMRDRLATQPGWEIVAVPYGHDLMREASEPMAELIAVLISSADEKESTR
jgi:pimeloyl-ACP methyl ester carboxylesterase